MEATCFFETFVDLHHTAWIYIPEDKLFRIIQVYFCHIAKNLGEAKTTGKNIELSQQKITLLAVLFIVHLLCRCHMKNGRSL
jgi:hypothetical protein